jgi:hypothetical protein
MGASVRKEILVEMGPRAGEGTRAAAAPEIRITWAQGPSAT